MAVVARAWVQAGSSATEAADPLQRQIACRATNEQIRTISSTVSGRGLIEMVCECERPGCFETVDVSPLFYEDVRRFPTRFLVKVGHVAPESDRVVVEADGVVAVEKVRPDDAEAAIRVDPRRKRLPARSRDRSRQ